MAFIWNQNHNGLVNLDKIRNFELSHDEYGIGVIAWISDSESIHLGRYDSEGEAITFLENIANERMVFKGYGKNRYKK